MPGGVFRNLMGLARIRRSQSALVWCAVRELGAGWLMGLLAAELPLTLLVTRLARDQLLAGPSQAVRATRTSGFLPISHLFG